MTRLRILSFFIIICCIPFFVSAYKQEGMFSGRVSKINAEGALIKIRVNFENVKYLNRKDLVHFWNVYNPQLRCKSYIIGRSSNYLLLKVSDFEYCIDSLHLSQGGYLQFYSEDLVNNLKMGKELLQILLKKRLTMNHRIKISQEHIDSYISKKEAINSRYKVLRDKLEQEWRQELANLEEDEVVSLRNHKELVKSLNDIDFKMEQYRITDQNLEEDRWSLDSRLFYKK